MTALMLRRILRCEWRTILSPTSRGEDSPKPLTSCTSCKISCQLLSEQMAAASLVFIFETEGRGTESERYAETWWIKVNHSNRISHEISVRLLFGLTIWVACAHIGTGNINRARRSAWKQLISGSWQLENYAGVHRSAVHPHHVLFQTCLWYVFI